MEIILKGMPIRVKEGPHPFAGKEGVVQSIDTLNGLVGVLWEPNPDVKLTWLRTEDVEAI